MNGLGSLESGRSLSARTDQDVKPSLTDRVAHLLVIVVGHVLQSDEQQVADELADLVLMNTLSGYDFSDLQDLRVSYLLDLLS